MARRAAIVLIVWGAWLGVATAVQAPFHPRVIEWGLLGGASAASLAAGLAVWVLDRRVRTGPAAIPDGSPGTGVLVAGLALALLGAGFGLWLILIGAGASALGLGLLAREERARRRALRERGGR
jgi:hypothetical protein